MIAGAQIYYTSSGRLPGVREIESHRNSERDADGALVDQTHLSPFADRVPA